MAINLPAGLPAQRILEGEGIASARAPWQSRPLEIALVNLMPNKPATELQFSRLLGAAPFDVNLTLIVPDGYEPHCTPQEHLDRFYRTWSTVRHQRFDGLIVTGAPVETIPFEQVTYWPELVRILDWTRDHVGHVYYVCWGAMAALYHFHGIATSVLPCKRFGVFEQTVREPRSPWLRGFTPAFPVPVSRRAEIAPAALADNGRIAVLAEAVDTGLCLLEEPARRALYMFNHLEYEATTLRDEYLRDLAAGLSVPLPACYFPHDDPAAVPADRWRPFAQLLFTNWLSGICGACLPGVDSERSLDWLLADAAGARAQGELVDFLVVANATPSLLPDVLQRVEVAGHRSLAAKLHHRNGGTALVELRVQDISAVDAERLVARLLRTPGVRRIAQRRSGGGRNREARLGCSGRSVHCSSLHPGSRSGGDVAAVH